MSESIFFNHEIEKDTLGCMLYDQESALKALVELKEDDFHDERNKVSFRAMKNLFKKDQPIDLLTVAAELDSFNIPGGREYIADIAANRAMSSVAIKGLIEKMVSMRKRRILYTYSVNLKRKAQEEADIEKVIDAAKDLPSLEGDSSDKIFGIKDLLEDAVNRMIERKNSGNKIHGMPTGFRDIDVMTGGLMRKEMTVIGARPSIGKSVLALNISTNVAKSGFEVLYFSLEMGKEQLTDRMISAELMIKNDKIKYPQLLDEEDLIKLNESTMEKDLKGLHIDDYSNSDIERIRAKCKESILKFGKLDLIVVDYLQYMPGKGATKRDIIENNSKGLKQIAKDFNIHVICISSLNRANEGRSDKRPTMADLRESGQIEFDADNIILMHRDRMAEKAERQKTDLIFEKQRNGKTGIVNVIFLEDYTAFKNMER